METRVGLFVGKFLAFHKGHEYYIRLFANECDKLNLILSANTKKDRIPYDVRRKWLEADLKASMPLSEVRHKIKLHTMIEDDITPYPEGIKEWCGEVENLLGEKIDVMFGNDDYVRECALEFGSMYFTPDQNRNVYNISSTKILDNGLKYYDYLTDVAKPYFNKKILILGPESTGKSTLAKKLNVYFNGKYIEEYGRTYEQTTIDTFNIRCTQWDVKDYERIAEVQNEMINEAMECPNKLIFIDTDALITQVYCEMYIKQNSKILDEYVSKQNFDLIIYLDYDNTNWIADGIRTLENSRMEVDKIIKNKLHELKREFIILKNDNGYDERFNLAKNIIIEKFKLS
jgi:HTH-type transcriptional repressor of NAD biosynthesis genes